MLHVFSFFKTFYLKYLDNPQYTKNETNVTVMVYNPVNDPDNEVPVINTINKTNIGIAIPLGILNLAAKPAMKTMNMNINISVLPAKLVTNISVKLSGSINTINLHPSNN